MMPSMYSKTRYRYFTPDGKVPCEGKVPTDKLPDMNTLAGIPKLAGPLFGFPPFGYGQFGFPAGFEYPPPGPPSAPPAGPPGWHCYPGPAAPAPWGVSPPGAPPTPPAGPPGWHCYPSPAAPQPWVVPPPAPRPSYPAPPPTPPRTPPPSWSAPRPPPPPPPPPSANRKFSVAQPWEQEEPVPGNRVKGELIKVGSSGAGYISPKHHVLIHLFCQNLVTKYKGENNFIMAGNDSFKAEIVPANMRFQELIEQLDTIKRARHHERHKNYPEEHCGVQELIKLGNNMFIPGQKIMMHDAMAQHTVGSVWPDSTEHSEPRYLVRWPV